MTWSATMRASSSRYPMPCNAPAARSRASATLRRTRAAVMTIVSRSPCLALSLLVDTPEHGDGRRRGQRLDVAAHGAYCEPLAKGNVGHGFGVVDLHLLGNLPLLFHAGRAHVAVAQLFHRRIARPARTRLLAGRGEKRRHQRIENVELHPAGRKGIPATLRRRPLLVGQPVDQALPI